MISCRALRSSSAWALPRPSAMASAKLAKSTVNQSQTRDREDEAASASPVPRQGLQPEDVVRMLPTSDDEHHRVAHLVPGIELDERVAGAPRRTIGGSNRPRCDCLRSCIVEPHLDSCSHACRCSTIGPERRAPGRRSARRPATTTATSSSDEQRRVRGQRAGAGRRRPLAASEPAIASIGIDHPVPRDEHRQPQQPCCRRACWRPARRRRCRCCCRPRRRRRAPRESRAARGCDGSRRARRRRPTATRRADQHHERRDQRITSDAIFISKASIFLPRYSGVRPTMSPATNTAMMAKTSMP